MISFSTFTLNLSYTQTKIPNIETQNFYYQQEIVFPVTPDFVDTDKDLNRLNLDELIKIFEKSIAINRDLIGIEQLITRTLQHLVITHTGYSASKMNVHDIKKVQKLGASIQFIHGMAEINNKFFLSKEITEEETFKLIFAAHSLSKMLDTKVEEGNMISLQFAEWVVKTSSDEQMKKIVQLASSKIPMPTKNHSVMISWLKN